MAGGRRRHTIRSYQRRIERVLSEERKRREPIPPPINAEHAALRADIAEAYSALFGPEDPESTTLTKRIMENPELATDALKVQDMLFAERDLLTQAGVNWRVYQPR
jgi:hypothetical protein